MPRGSLFSDEVFDKIKDELCEHCENVWREKGYKKTNIKQFCDELGTSVGTFYKIFDSKEDMFCETLERIQKRMLNKFDETITNNPSKEGFADAIKGVYREYNKIPYLYDVNSVDFIAFSSKLPKDKFEKLHIDIIDFFNKAFDKANLKLKMDKATTYSILNLLLASINNKSHILPGINHVELFDLRLDLLMDHLFMERNK